MRQNSSKRIVQTKSTSGDQQEQTIRIANEKKRTTTTHRQNTLQSGSEVDLERPISPSNEFRFNKRGKPYKLYLKVREKLPEWWEEFNRALDKSGMVKYRTVREFALANLKNKRQQELLCEMIGPRPDRKRVRGPWLGDWTQRRMEILLSPPLPEEIKPLAQSFQDKLAPADAVRSAALLLTAELAGYTKMSEQNYKMFAGMPLNPNYPPDSSENQARFRAFQKMQFPLMCMQTELLDRWMKIHGMGPRDPRRVSQRKTNLRKKVPKGSVNRPGSDYPWREMELIKLARALQAHEKNFGLPVPKEILGDVTEVERPVRSKQNDETD